MKKIGLRQLAVILISAFMNRAVLLMMNPFGIAYFAAAYLQKPGRLLLTLVSLLGMSLIMPGTVLLKYTGVILCIIIVEKILTLCKKEVTPLKMALISGIIVAAASSATSLIWQSGMETALDKRIVVALLEGAVTTGMCIVFNQAVETLLYYRGRKVLSSFSFISVAILFGVGISPYIEKILEEISIVEAIGFYGILYMGYRLGVGAGTAIYKRPVGQEDEDVGLLVSSRLKDFSDSFKKLSKTFDEGYEPKTQLSPDEMTEVFDELAMSVCEGCGRRNFCWESEFKHTCKGAYDIINYLSKNDEMNKNQVPGPFKQRCIHIDHFLAETKKFIDVAKLNMSWENRLKENQLVVAGQLNEVAEIIDGFSTEILEKSEVDFSIETILKGRMARRKIDVKKVVVVERKPRRQSVFIVARTKKGRCATVKEMGEIVSEALNKNYIPSSGCKSVVTKEYHTFEFIESVHFKTIQGMARRSKDGEKISGDSYSFIPLESGQFIMSLSDGMGTGEAANQESEGIIELLEQLIETGFEKKAAIKLINSVMVLRSGQRGFSTIDMSIIDLYSGICEFVKVGASTTYIRRDGWVETIQSTTLPVGAFTQVDYDGITKKLYDGDMVIMVTDGVANCFLRDGGNGIEKMLIEMKDSSPHEVANQVLETALTRKDYGVSDDMTVLVCGVYRK